MNEQEANATGRQATLAEQRHRVEALAVACSIDEQRLVLEPTRSGRWPGSTKCRIFPTSRTTVRRSDNCGL